ncbi:MAG: helix-turn-helix transcriptional regulator [Clostridiales bacterium]|nr:helix-turn-helix transcriptional regulator [Clostridiales bacterium]
MIKDSKEIINYTSLPGITVTYETAPVSFPPHWHSAAEFILVLKDNCRYRIGDTEICAKKGDIVLIWPRELHEVIKVPDRSTVFIQFDPSLLENNLDLVSISRLMSSCHLIESRKYPKLAGSVGEKILKANDIFTGDDHLKETRCKLITGEIILLIGEYVIREYEEQIGKDHKDPLWNTMRAASAYISEHASEDITEAMVAADVGLSPTYFSRVFKKYMQTTFPNYLSAVRVRRAIMLLSDESLSITECGLMSGFQSSTTFNRVFRDLTSLSPRQYRKFHITDHKS